ncbi:hypothetical protein C2G38_2121699, partial [Gigaspora rosea]
YSKTAKKKTTNDILSCYLKQRCRPATPPNSLQHSTSSHPELCDSCGRLLVNNNSTVFACGHGYHIDCYREKCTHCEEFYKKGIFKNVRKFLTRIEKGEDKLTKEDIDDDETMWKVRRKSLRM